MARRGQGIDRGVWRAAGEISEALARAETAADLGQAVMEAIDRMVECDLGSILSGAPGGAWTTAGEKEDTRVVTANQWRYALEMSPAELARLSLRFTRDKEIYEPSRRDRMSIYEEFLRPNRQSGFVARYWFMDGRLWGIGLCRGASFSERDRDRLDALFPQIKAAVRAGSWLQGGAAPWDGRAWSLTNAEARTTELVVRGLTNVEVAGLLGVSPHTIRNTLAQVFKKMGVSRRSELAFMAARGLEDDAVARARSGRAYDRQVAVSAAIDPRSTPRR